MNLEPEPDFIYEPEPEPDNTNITDPSYCYNRDPIEPVAEDAIELDKRDNLSYMNVNNIEEGVEWYKRNFPKVPDDLYPIMARWNWGDLSTLTKKDVKNDKKRVAKGKKPKNCGFKMEKGNFVVKFD